MDRAVLVHKGKRYYIPKSQLNNPRVRLLLRQKGTYIIDHRKKIFTPYTTKKIRRPTIVRRHLRRTKKTKTIVKKHERDVLKRVRTAKPVKRIIRPKRIKRIIVRRRLTGLDIENLKKLADKHGVERDLIDWESEIDPSLSYDENKTSLESKIKDLSPIYNTEYQPEHEQMLSDMEKQYIEDLQFKATAGDVEAKEELSYIMDEFKHVR